MNEERSQWEQDVSEYGDNAYLMWFCDQLNSGNPDFKSNIEFIEHFKMGYSIRRKESAALQFDIEMAKAGDEVEWLNNDGKWEFVPQNNLAYLHGQDHRLRMKYPLKINSTKETEYCTYPECTCPFDAPSNNPDWCAIALPHKPK